MHDSGPAITGQVPRVDPTPRGIRGRIHRLWHAFDGLAGDVLWSGAHDFLTLVTAFTSFQLLQRALAVETYGAYFGLYGLVGAFGALSYSGIGLAALQRLMGEGDDPNRSLRSFLSLTMIAGFAVSAVVGLVAVVSLTLAPGEIFLVVAAELLAVAVIFVAAVLIQAKSGYPAAARVRMGIVGIRLFTVVGLHLIDQLTIANLAAGYLFGFSVYGLYLVLVHLPRHGYWVDLGRPTGMSVRSSAMFSIPMGAAKLQTDADKWFLNVFRFGTDAGLYGAAYRVVQLGTLPLLALDSAAFQRFLPQGDGRPGLHWRRSVRLAALMLVASVAVSIGLYFALPILDFLFADGYKEAVDIVPWLLLLIPLISTSSTPLNGLLGLGQADKRMYVYLSSAVLSMVLYIALIPLWSWEGAVVATAVSEVYLVIAGWIALWFYQRRADGEAVTEDQGATVVTSA